MRPYELPSGKTHEWKKPMTPVYLQGKHRKPGLQEGSGINLLMYQTLNPLLFVSTIKDDSLSLSHSLFAGSG